MWFFFSSWTRIQYLALELLSYKQPINQYSFSRKEFLEERLKISHQKCIWWPTTIYQMLQCFITSTCDGQLDIIEGSSMKYKLLSIFLNFFDILGFKFLKSLMDLSLEAYCRCCMLRTWFFSDDKHDSCSSGTETASPSKATGFTTSMLLILKFLWRLLY